MLAPSQARWYQTVAYILFLGAALWFLSLLAIAIIYGPEENVIVLIFGVSAHGIALLFWLYVTYTVTVNDLTLDILHYHIYPSLFAIIVLGLLGFIGYMFDVALKFSGATPLWFLLPIHGVGVLTCTVVVVLVQLVMYAKWSCSPHKEITRPLILN